MTRGALAEPSGAIEKGSSLIPSEEYLKVGGAGFNTASQQRKCCVLCVNENLDFISSWRTDGGSGAIPFGVSRGPFSKGIVIIPGL